ncbi:C-4 methylsterol oxidase [Ceratobasidium theobromae]|uniref:C-4 methylsterol oxidase n=1 Tax=Ceratobasidium theobromae TaxID=1582974 RepID=A0A5N5QBD7_9AGAM|nr:C-4 methylsterol oxidase [Ceratobasidium theobromae]
MNSTRVFDHRAASSELYAAGGTDFSKLSWLESNWAAWYLWIGDPVIATGLMSFLLHEIVYFGRCIPWIIIDAMPYFRRWKLQPNKVPTAKDQWECTKLVLYSHFTIELPQIWFFHPIAEACGMKTWQVPFPHWKAMTGQIALFFIFEDAFHYFAHQALHYGPLYKHIHKVHHKYSAPFGLAAEYAHPAEVFILGMGTIGGPLLYYFPWSLNHIIPFWSGADHHDFHHMAFVNNFSTSFRWLDYMFGTDDKYRAYKKRLAAVAEKDRAALEKKLLEEAEKEGVVAADEAEKKRLF